MEASSLNWEVIDNNKVFYSEKNDPPPAYAEIIESTFTKDSGNDSYNKENENSGDLPPCYLWKILTEKWYPYFSKYDVLFYGVNYVVKYNSLDDSGFIRLVSYLVEVVFFLFFFLKRIPSSLVL